MKFGKPELKPAAFVSIVAACALFGSNVVFAKEYVIKDGSSSGSSITSLFSFKSLGGDNRTNLSTFQGSDSLGDVHGQIVADYDTTGRSCDGGGFEFKVFFSEGVLNYKKGQLFLVAAEIASDPNYGCLYLGGFPAATTTLSIKYFIAGGTGEYEGANGELTSVSTGTLLHNDLTSGADNQFGSFQSEYEGWFSTD